MSDVKSPAPIRTDNRPLYTRAIDAMRELILGGDYKIGDRLPKESTLAHQLGISRSTLRVAMGYLETCGLISRRPNVGTFVAAKIPLNSKGSYISSLDRFETLLQIAKRTEMDLRIISREVSEVAAPAAITGAFGLAQGDLVVRVQAVESIDGRPAAYLDTYLSKDTADQHDVAVYQDDVITLLGSDKVHAPSHTRSEIWAVNAPECVASKLDLEVGQAVLHLEETFYAESGICVATSYNYFVTDVFRFYIIRRLAHSY